MLQKTNFTKELLSNLNASAKRYHVEDLKTPGLRVTVFPSGIKTFYLYKSINGKTEKIKLGRYSDISIEAARKKTIELKAQITLGQTTPITVEKKEDLKFQELYSLYYNHHLRYKKRANDYKKLFDGQILPLIGRMRVGHLSRAYLKKLQSDIARTRGKISANKTLDHISAALNFGINNDYFLGTNFCKGIKRFPKRKRDRFLSRKELSLFFAALQNEEQIYQDLFETIILTGARKTTVLSMQWEELDFELKQWRRKESDSKNNDINIIYLSDRVIEILFRRKNRSDSNQSSKYVFPGTGKAGHLVDPKKAIRRIRAHMKTQDFTIHDLRRTLGSYMAISGASLPIIGKALNHKSLTSTEIYARLSNDPVHQAVLAAGSMIKEHIHIRDFKENSVFTKQSSYQLLSFADLV